LDTPTSNDDELAARLLDELEKIEEGSTAGAGIRAMLHARRYVAAGQRYVPADKRMADLLAALKRAAYDDATQAALLTLLECQASPTLWASRAGRVEVARALAQSTYHEAPAAPRSEVFASARGAIDPQTRYEDRDGWQVGNPWPARWDLAAYARALAMNPGNNRTSGSANDPQHRPWRVTCKCDVCAAPVQVRQTKTRRQCARAGCRVLAPTRATKRWRYCSNTCRQSAFRYTRR
jgi:hypothetical protein